MYYIKRNSTVIVSSGIEAYPQYVYVTDTDVPTNVRKKPRPDPETGLVCIITCGLFLHVDEDNIEYRVTESD